MRLLRLSTLYEGYAEGLLGPAGARSESYEAAHRRVCEDFFSWADGYSVALRKRGHQAADVFINAEPLQRLWAAEHGLPADCRLEEIAVRQVEEFRPEVLWYDDTEAALLAEILRRVPSIRLVLGWVGSAIAESKVWRMCGLVLSCAPESVERLAAGGCRARHLNHAFDPRVLERVERGPVRYSLSFFGQLIRRSEFHVKREELLERLAGAVDVAIFTPSHLLKPELVKTRLKQFVFDALRRGRASGRLTEAKIAASPLWRRAAEWRERPVEPVNRRLKPRFKPAVFGLDMYRAIADSAVTLNIHADSSPRFASNMRLFETTGVGTCLLTDWRPNLGRLFDPDSELAAYRSADECIERARWLLDHPAERECIAAAGQARCLRDHSFERRAAELEEIIAQEYKRV